MKLIPRDTTRYARKPFLNFHEQWQSKMSKNIERMLVSTLLYLTKTGIDTDIASLKHQGAKNNLKGIIVFYEVW